MDRNVTVRFFEVTEAGGGRAPLRDILFQLDALPKRDREETIDEGVRLRLEDVRERNGLLIGDITRVQTRNLPGHVLDDNVERLPVDQIGHSTAFIYDPANGCLAVQFDMQTGVGRICKYLAAATGSDNLGYLPYLRRDTLDRFRGQHPTRLRIKVARVRNFAHLGNEKTDFEEQIEEWSDLFDAPSVEIIMSTRGEGRHLDSARVWNTIRRWIGFTGTIQGIKNVEAETIEADEAFNFLKDLLCEQSTLDLPDNDPLASRGVRQAYVMDCYTIHREYINRVSGHV